MSAPRLAAASSGRMLCPDHERLVLRGRVRRVLAPCPDAAEGLEEYTVPADDPREGLR